MGSPKKVVKKATNAFVNPLFAQGAEASKAAVDAVVPDIPAMPPPPPPPPAMKVPDAAAAADRARVGRETADELVRRRGRRSTVITGPEGVGATPLGFKTLVGS